MKILIAPDKFKDSLTAKEVCDALTRGIRKTNSEVTISCKPLADGGDGSLEVLSHYVELETIPCTVHDPLFRPMAANYKMADQTAYIEMAAASGLVLLKEAERNPLFTTSIGTGELIRDALQKGATSIYLFIGGSATNDGGIGIAHALGYRFYDSQDQLLSPIGRSLNLIHRIDNSQLLFDVEKVQLQVICDVNNPFFGKNGAAYVYAPQKGATAEQVPYLDMGLRNLAQQLMYHRLPPIGLLAGAGAAGGIGGGAVAFLNAELVSGMDTFIQITQLEAAIKACDVLITGEGKLDEQSMQGKVVSGVCQLAEKYKIPVIAVCGDATISSSDTLKIRRIYTILERCKSLKEAMENAESILEEIGSSMNLY